MGKVEREHSIERRVLRDAVSERRERKAVSGLECWNVSEWGGAVENDQNGPEGRLEFVLDATEHELRTVPGEFGRRIDAVQAQVARIVRKRERKPGDRFVGRSVHRDGDHVPRSRERRSHLQSYARLRAFGADPDGRELPCDNKSRELRCDNKTCETLTKHNHNATCPARFQRERSTQPNSRPRATSAIASSHTCPLLPILRVELPERNVELDAAVSRDERVNYSSPITFETFHVRRLFEEPTGGNARRPLLPPALVAKTKSSGSD